ncbi:hypothetical protein TMatcc_003111 [Talaromyces marneffei ATCC 18224]
MNHLPRFLLHQLLNSLDNGLISRPTVSGIELTTGRARAAPNNGDQGGIIPTPVSSSHTLFFLAIAEVVVFCAEIADFSCLDEIVENGPFCGGSLRWIGRL